MKGFLYFVALIAGIAGIIGSFISIPYVSSVAPFLVMGGFIILAIGYMIKRK